MFGDFEPLLAILRPGRDAPLSTSLAHHQMAGSVRQRPFDMADAPAGVVQESGGSVTISRIIVLREIDIDLMQAVEGYRRSRWNWTPRWRYIGRCWRVTGHRPPVCREHRIVRIACRAAKALPNLDQGRIDVRVGNKLPRVHGSLDWREAELEMVEGVSPADAASEIQDAVAARPQIGLPLVPPSLRL